VIIFKKFQDLKENYYFMYVLVDKIVKVHFVGLYAHIGHLCNSSNLL